MKRIFIALMVMLTIAVSTHAMSYNQARREALFLTDKMAYELNLTPEQYDAAYEINMDYLMGVTSVDDVYSDYWTRRNLDLSYILLDWQWNAFRAASYFYKPLYWDGGFWHFGVYARYPRRHFFYFDRPTVYVDYRGGHGWRANGGRSFYYDRRNDFRQPKRQELGMRDRWDRGDFNGARSNNGNFNGNGGFNNNGNNSNGFQNNGDNRFQGGNFGTANNRKANVGVGGSNSQGSFGGARSNGSFSSSSLGTVNRSSGSAASKGGNSGFSQSRTNGTFGGGRPSTSNSPSKSTPSNGTFSGRSNTTYQPRSGSFSIPQRQTTTPSTMPSSSRPSGSFGGARSGGSFGGGSSNKSTSNGGGNSSNSRGTFGGAR